MISSLAKSELVVSRSPAIELAKYRDYLIMYHMDVRTNSVGCFSSIYYGDMADLLHQNRSTASANANIQEAIRK
jgi:hypothetical protein